MPAMSAGAAWSRKAALSPATHAALFNRFAWGLIPGEHILGYPVPGAEDDMTPGRRRYSFVWYRPVDGEASLRDMQTDAAGRYHPDGIPPQAIRPDLIDGLHRDADALLCPAFAEVVRIADRPLFQPVGDLESPRIAFGRVALPRRRRLRRAAARGAGRDQGRPRRDGARRGARRARR